MSVPVLQTERLELTPLWPEAIDALLAGDAERLRLMTGAVFRGTPAAPPYMADTLPVVRDRLREAPDEAPWWNWLLTLRGSGEAVGSVAFGGKPDANGAVLIGYAIYREQEGHGYAAEAVRALVNWAFTQPGVQVVRALAPVWNTPAVRVAENVGMQPVAADEDDEVGEVLVYEIKR